MGAVIPFSRQWNALNFDTHTNNNMYIYSCIFLFWNRSSTPQHITLCCCTNEKALKFKPLADCATVLYSRYACALNSCDVETWSIREVKKDGASEKGSLLPPTFID